MAAKKKRKWWVTALRWTALGVVAREAYLGLGASRQHRRDTFNLAQYRASTTGKPLIVIGDPNGGINRVVGPDFDCGQMCIEPTTEALAKSLPRLDSNGAVIFVSRTLEYVDSIEPVLEQLKRIAGDDLFVVTAPPWTITSLFSPGSKRQFFSAPPEERRFEWRPHYWAPAETDARTYDLVSGFGTRL